MKNYYYFYKKCDDNKSKELDDIFLCLEDVHIFYKEKLKNLEKDLEDQNKLYKYRFKKVKEIIKIFKIFEMMFYFIEYIKLKNLIIIKKICI